MDHRRHSSTSQKECIRNLPYYHCNFKSADEVANFIKRKAKSQVGVFLLRPSSRNQNLLTVSVLCKDKTVRHLHIQIYENGGTTKFYLVTDKQFDSLEELVHHYSVNPVKNLEGVDHVFFKVPLCHDQAKTNGIFRSSSHTSHGSSASMLHHGSSSGSVSSLPRVPNGHGLPPPLPLRPRTSSHSASQDSFGDSDASLSNASGMNKDRPPLPLPQDGDASDKSLYYSRARDVTEDISQKLIEQLQMSEKCECGIPRRLAELPLGWTVHLSKDANTEGKLFFQNSDGVTSWTIPEEVKMQLTKVHKANLSKISPTWQGTLARKPPSSSSSLSSMSPKS